MWYVDWWNWITFHLCIVLFVLWVGNGAPALFQN
jgi:hypothetical protein